MRTIEEERDLERGRLLPKARTLVGCRWLEDFTVG